MQGGLPELALLFRWTDHGVAGLATEGGVKFRDIHQRAVGAKSCHRMGIRLQLHAQRLRPVLAAPNPRECQEKALIGGVAVNRGRRRLAPQ